MAWVVVVGRIGRDLALRTARLPDEGGTEPVIERFDRLGGKGPNQAVGLARLGVPVDLIGVVDRDAAGAAMVGEAAADGIDVEHRQSTPTTPIAASPSALVSEEDLDQIDPADHGSSSGQIDGTPEDGDSFFDVTD